MTYPRTNIPQAWTKKAVAAGVLVAALLMGGLLALPAHASTTFTVNSITDFADVNTTDDVCDADAAVGQLCTLRAAIEQANATPGADTINFDIPGTGVHTVSPQTPLPNIIEQVTINGFSQPGASPNALARGTNAKLLIELDGSGLTNAGERTGLSISASDSVVQGLVINRFGGLAGGAGVHIVDTANLVSLKQNFIGADPTGTLDRGNASGIFDQGFGTSIGGPFAQDANLISGNDGPGIAIRNLASNTQVSHNLIGTDKTGTKRLGNLEEGVEISDSSGNSVVSNTIAFNGKDGVSVAGGGVRSGIVVGTNPISANSIFSNGGLGINLIDPSVLVPVGESEGPTPNDLGDGDIGPNGLQNKPVLSSAKTVSGKTTIKGKLNSSRSETFTIEFFSNPKGNEGKKFIGQKSVRTDGSGNRSFTFSPAKAVAVGKTITATATRSSTLDTSEFSAPRKVASS